jgi:membrane fusion protein, multidrug efflux system
VVMRETQLAQAQQDYHRNVNLLKIHGVSRQEYQHSRTRWRAAKAALSVVRHQLGGLQALVGNTDLQQHPQVELAASRLESAYLNLQRMNILAPITGYVAQREVQVGDKVSPGDPLLAIVPLDQVWAEANFKETQLQDMRIGQRVEITADFYGSDVIYHGRVQGLVPGTGSAFSLLPPQNATGNWIKIVQRVPVRINLKRNELRRHPLLLQLSLNTTVDVHDTSGPRLAHASQNKPVYSTDVYRGRLEGAQLLIDRIIAENSGKRGTRAIARDSDGR